MSHKNPPPLNDEPIPTFDLWDTVLWAFFGGGILFLLALIAVLLTFCLVIGVFPCP